MIYDEKKYKEWNYKNTTVTVWDFVSYAEECYADTIRAKEYRLGDIGDAVMKPGYVYYKNDAEYIIEHETYREMVTERQLMRKGYLYQYRWVKNTIIDEDNPIEFEYIFVKEPTLKGFIKWIENK